MQKLDLVASSDLASKVTLPSLSKDVIDALSIPKTVVSSVANGFLPTITASAKPPANGVSLTLNVTSVRSFPWALAQILFSEPLSKLEAWRT